MCRMVVFAGNCTRCGRYFTWDSLDQAISCLEAKNNGRFGDCRRGINMDQHQANAECAACNAQYLLDEGLSMSAGAGAGYSASSSASSSRNSANKRQRVR